MKKILFFLMVLMAYETNAQDTIFNKSLDIPLYINNVTSDGSSLFIRSFDSIYIWENSKLKFITKAESKFSWLNHSGTETLFKHTEYIPISLGTNLEIKHLIPGCFNGNITSTRVKDKFYICYNGKILEYKIFDNVLKHLDGISIRHIYFDEKTIQIVSTYGGVFINLVKDGFKIDTNSFKNPIAGYSNGSFNKIGNRYFLCQDDLLELDIESRTFKNRKKTEGQGRFRQLFEFKNKVFSLMTIGVNILNMETFEFEEELFSNQKITSFLILNDLVIFGSSENGIYTLDTNFNIKNIKAPKNINAIIDYNQDLLMCTDEGLFRFNLKTGESKQINPNRYLHTIVKFNSGYFYSGDRGLYWYDGNKEVTIIEGVEFNKLGLTVNKNCLYAGSINGLYFISHSNIKYLTSNLDSVVPKQNISNENSEQPNFSLIMIFLFISIFGIVAYIIFKVLKKKKEDNKTIINETKLEITSESVRTLIRKNESIKSVSDVADYFNTSVSQVNRRLLLENISPLECLKAAKKEVALEMNQEGKSIEEISKRVGYSKRYVRENLLK